MIPATSLTSAITVCMSIPCVTPECITEPGLTGKPRWAHVYLSMTKAGVAHWAAKAGHASLHWQDNTYTQTATSDSGKLLYTIVHTEVRQDSDLEP
jgi:hypothetical protein